jgi:hypothetical protein
MSDIMRENLICSSRFTEGANEEDKTICIKISPTIKL